jgi:hypothetical protein
MHQKLRHQLNIHKISGSIMEQQNSTSFFPFFFKKKKEKRKKKKEKRKHMLHNKEDSIVQACKVKAT